MAISRKHQIAAAQVAALFDQIPSAQRGLIHEFPRPIRAVICEIFPVHFVSDERITATLIRREAEIEISDDEVDEPLGYLVAKDESAVIFATTSRGADSQRFTEAHEIAHLVLEHLPHVASPEQLAFLNLRVSREARRCRDDRQSLLVDDSAEVVRTASPLARKEAEREKKMNWFATEFLAPHRQVIEETRDLKTEEARVDLVRRRFGLSRTAAIWQLRDLGLYGPGFGENLPGVY